MEYNGRHIPDEVIIGAADEMGYIKLPTEEWLSSQLFLMSPDLIGERYVTEIARLLHDKLKGGADGTTRDHQPATVGGGGDQHIDQGGKNLDNQVPW